MQTVVNYKTRLRCGMYNLGTQANNHITFSGLQVTLLYMVKYMHLPFSPCGPAGPPGPV